MDVALDTRGVELALTADGEGIVGFEHAPTDAAQQTAVARAEEALRAGARLLSMAPAARCALATVEVQSPYATTSVAGGHADWKASYRFECADAAAIMDLDFSGLFAAFPGLQTLKLQLISSQGQTGANLTPSSPRMTVAGP